MSRDGDYYATVQSNSTGYIEWTYTEGYSDHTFDATLQPSQNVSMESAAKVEQSLQPCQQKATTIRGNSTVIETY